MCCKDGDQATKESTPKSTQAVAADCGRISSLGITRHHLASLGHNKISAPISEQTTQTQGDPVANGIPQLQQESAAEIPSLLCAH